MVIVANVLAKMELNETKKFWCSKKRELTEYVRVSETVWHELNTDTNWTVDRWYLLPVNA